MNPFTSIVMFAWIPVVIGLFALLPPRRAVTIAFLMAWLFLPMAKFEFQGLPDYTKMSATCMGVMMGVVLFDSKRLNAFRFRWIDLPILIWCLCPFPTSMLNGLGIYDGFSASLERAITWGMPFFIGRLYYGSLLGMRELAIGIFIGGLAYVPLCLFEIRMSPQLHRMVYGFHQHDFAQTVRLGGWRPTVFMQHGLMVGMWMTTASLVGIWLWTTGSLRKLWNVPMAWLVLPLLLTTLLVKSTGALALLMLGAGMLLSVKWFRTLAPVMLLILVPPAYMAVRTTGWWSGEDLVELVRDVVNEERAESLEFRIQNETLLAEKAAQRPVFGWGGWGRNRVYNAKGEDISVTDAFWVIAYGVNGFVGLAASTAVFLLPAFVLARKLAPRAWAVPVGAPLAAVAVLITLHMIDCLQNGMINPLFTLAAGALSGLVVAVKRR